MIFILTAGVAPQWLAEQAAKGIDVGERHDPQAIAASIQKLQQGMKQLDDVTLKGFMLRPGEDANWAEFVTLLKSRKWDGITFGGGVRTIPSLSDYFTELVRIATREQSQAVLMFPLLPEDVLMAIKKYVLASD